MVNSSLFMKWVLSILLVSCFLIVLPLSAETGVVLRGGREEYNLGKHLGIYEDKTGVLTIDQVSSTNFRGVFEKSRVDSPGRWYSLSAFWLKVSVDNRSVVKKWVLTLGYPFQFYIDFFYRKKGENRFRVVKTGLARDFKNRFFGAGRFSFPVAPGSADTGNYYFRIKSYCALNFSLLCRTVDSFAGTRNLDLYFLGVFFGILFIMLWYNFFLFLSLRTMEYLYFTFFLFIVLGIHIFLNGLVHVFFSRIAAGGYVVYTSMLVLMSVFLLRLTSVFFRLKKTLPRFHSLYLVFQVLIVLNFAGASLSLGLGLGVGIRFLFRALAIVFHSSSFLLMLVTGLLLWVRKKEPVKLYLLSLMLVVMGALVIYFVRNGILPSNSFTENAYRFALVFMVLTMSLALSGRIREVMDEAHYAYRKLCSSEKDLKTIFNQTFDAFIIHDIDGKILDVNERMLEMYRVERENFLSLSIANDLSSSDNPLSRLPDIWRRVVAGEAVDFEWNAKRPCDQSEFPAEVLLKRISYGGGDVVLAVIRDLTERKKVEAQLIQAQKMETVGNLAGGLAHDFNNVLGGIVSVVSIMDLKFKKETLDCESLKKYIGLIKKSGERATDMVSRLLTLSRKEKLSLSRVDLNDIVNNVIEIAKNTFDKSIDLKFHILDRPAYIDADPTRIEQILLNLCINAAHSMTLMRSEGEQWGGVLEVRLRKSDLDEMFCSRNEGAVPGWYWEVSVRDSGIGIPDDIMDKIFNPFFSTKSSGSGTGLGLSMVYNMTRQHNGFIEVDSEPGRGSVFNLYFPLSDKPAEGESLPGEEDKPHSGGVILVIDDELVMRTIAGEILSELGFDVISCGSGSEGLRIIDDKKGELRAVILDMAMPEMSGKEVFEEIQKRNASIPVLLTSGFRLDGRVEEVLAGGAGGFLQKPYRYNSLSSAIFKLLEEGRA